MSASTLAQKAVRNPGDLTKPANLNAFINNINQALFNLAKRTTVNLEQINSTKGDGWTTVLDDGTNLIKFQWDGVNLNFNINGVTSTVPLNDSSIFRLIT